MSYSGQSAMDKLRLYGTIMIVALLAPLLISFILWIVGSAFASGGGVAPGITYGIYQITSASAPSSIAGQIYSGVSYFWINSAANGGLASSPAFPSVMVTILNAFIIIISLAVAVFTGIEFVGSLLEYANARR